jgi:glycosyltransferase involved in cell wall biosynthesis
VAKKSVEFHYIPNGIDENLVGFEDIPKDLEALIPKGRFIVGYAGTIGLANALEHFVDAALSFSYDEGITFLIVGDGYLKQELILKCANCDHILFYPKIKKAQIQNLLTYFDVAFVGRAGSELFSHGVSANKYFDYMLAGLPILDSNNLIKDPVELSGCGIIVEPDSTDAIVKGIKQLKKLSQEILNQLGSQGKSYVQEHHLIGVLANEYLKIIK